MGNPEEQRRERQVVQLTEPDRDFWDFLGLPSRGAELFRALHDGIPFSVYDNLAKLAKMEKGDLARAVSIPRSTLQRRAKTGRFTLAEGDRLYRFAEVLKAGIDLFEGDPAKARDWMLRPAGGLGGQKPVQMIATMAETEGVLELVGRIERGVVT